MHRLASFYIAIIGFIIICFTVQIEGVVIFSWGYGDPCDLQVRIPPVASLVKCFLYPSPYTDNDLLWRKNFIKENGGGRKGLAGKKKRRKLGKEKQP